LRWSTISSQQIERHWQLISPLVPTDGSKRLTRVQAEQESVLQNHRLTPAVVHPSDIRRKVNSTSRGDLKKIVSREAQCHRNFLP